MTVAYVPGSGATLVPAVMPPACVHAAHGDPACVLAVHHLRERKTGPQVPVTVVHCRTHRRAFTLYPLGHVPYGRLAVAPVALDGQVLLSSEREPPAGERRPAWRATQLGVAFAAIEATTVKLTDPRWWATQPPERLAQSAALLGVHPRLAVPDADAIAFRLEIPRLVLRLAADDYAHARGRAARGRVPVGVLDPLGADACPRARPRRGCADGGIEAQTDARSQATPYVARALAGGAVPLPDRRGGEGPRALGAADGRRRARGRRADPPDARRRLARRLGPVHLPLARGARARPAGGRRAGRAHARELAGAARRAAHLPRGGEGHGSLRLGPRADPPRAPARRARPASAGRSDLGVARVRPARPAAAPRARQAGGRPATVRLPAPHDDGARRRQALPRRRPAQKTRGRVLPRRCLALRARGRGRHRRGRGAVPARPARRPPAVRVHGHRVPGSRPRLPRRLAHFLDHGYNRQPHEALGGQTPLERFEADTRALRFPDSDAALAARFVVTETRKVSADNVISYAGTDFEIPRGHAGTEITVGRHLLSGALSVVHDGALVTLAPVDLAANAVARRAIPPAPAPEDDEAAPRTAAQLAFARAFAPVVGPDCGFPAPSPPASTTKGRPR